MAKQLEKLRAKEYYFKFMKQNEIAKKVKVQPKTIGDWIKKFGWKKERDARFNGSKKRLTDLKKIIGILTQQRIDLEVDIDSAKQNGNLDKLKDLQVTSNKIADEVSKYNKALESFDKENRISLSVYIDVMEQIFNAIQSFDMELYMQLLNFQEEHLTEISLKLG